MLPTWSRGAVLSLDPRHDPLVSTLHAACDAAGFDLTHPFSTRWYNEVVSPDLRLPDFGRPDALAVLVANTRALWPAFRLALRLDPALAALDHPLDTYAEARIGSAASSLPARSEVRYAHDVPPRRVAIQRAAHEAGFAWLAPSHLSIHPTYGPWIALRAIVVLDAQGPLDRPAPLERPARCECASACEPALQNALASMGDAPLDQDGVIAHWEAWVAVRDACPMGASHRYGNDQLRYHYARDRSVLT